jgi:sulfite oxidase
MFKNIKLLVIPFGIYGVYRYSKKNSKRYTYEEVKRHNKTGDIWVIRKDDVYDVSKFVESHPGGKDKIMLAAGQSIDPYWNAYRQHDNQNVQEILETMKIGEIIDYEPTTDIDPYINDPIRDINLKFHSYKPCNAETPVQFIADNPLTPTDLWYIRNHHPVPDINKDDFFLSISGKGVNKRLTVSDLKKLKRTSLTTTIQCGGNRRDGYNDIDKTSGTPWDVGAISTAKWSGVLLSDIVKVHDKNAKHIQFESEDTLKASVPIEKLRKKEVLIAYEMNGKPIPRDHGYPLRAIVPGYVGVRNVKWLSKITLSDQEAEGPWQRSISYKVLPSDIKDASKIDSTKIPTMQEMPLQSAITNIRKENDKYIVEGYAWTGSGDEITKVEISNDDGATWSSAGLNKELNKNQKSWAWTIWKDEHVVSDNPCFMCRAFDKSGKSQPDALDKKWNVRGLNNNTWHRKCYEE